MTKRADALQVLPKGTNQRHGGQPLTSPRALGTEVEVYSARRGMRAFLVASNHRTATLRVDNAWPQMSTGQRITLEGKRGGYGPVQFHLQIIDDPRGQEGQRRRFIQARWVLVTAVEKRAYLVKVLREIMGIDARLVTLSACGEDVLGSHRKLLFEVDKQRVRLINIGESVLPSSGQNVEAATPSPHSPSAPLNKRTQPGIVISTVEST